MNLRNRILPALVAALFLGACSARAAIVYVDQNSTNAVAPYSSWATAATDIPAAVAQAGNGDTVLITNGNYSIPSAITVTHSISLESVNGPDVTTVACSGSGNFFNLAFGTGYQTNWISGLTFRDGYSCVLYLPAGTPNQVVTVSNCWFHGFSDRVIQSGLLTSNLTVVDCVISNGLIAVQNGNVFDSLVVNNTQGLVTCEVSNSVIIGNAITTGGINGDGSGAGAVGSTLTDCLIVSNSSAGNGAGIYAGTAINCIISNNVSGAQGGGIYSGTATGCTIYNNSAANGGGVSGGTVTGCAIYGNYATNQGGGIFNSTAYTSGISNNVAGADGGGMYGGTANSCLFYQNTAATNGGGMAAATAQNCTILYNYASNNVGGLDAGISRNSIIWYNDSGVGLTNDFSGTEIVNSSWPGAQEGYGNNITNAPAFVDMSHGNYRLKGISPYINAGNNSFVQGSSDLDGHQRITAGFVDLGAYESVDTDHDGLTDAEEAFYGTNPLLADTDGDGISDWDEIYQTGTDPLNPYSNTNGILDGYELPIVVRFRAELQTNGAAYGFYTSNALLKVAVGELGGAITGTNFTLNLQLEQANDLGTWTNAGSPVLWSLPVAAEKKFFRLQAGP